MKANLKQIEDLRKFVEVSLSIPQFSSDYLIERDRIFQRLIERNSLETTVMLLRDLYNEFKFISTVGDILSFR